MPRQSRRGPRFPPGVMRERVRALHESGLTAIEIAGRLEVAKSTVTYHLRHIGVPIQSRFARRYDWTAIFRRYEDGATMDELASELGFSRFAFYEAARRHEIQLRASVIPLEELLVVGRRTARDHLKRRLMAAGVKTNRCEECGITEWQGEPLTMQLHHVNGDGTDNRLGNLQFLCGNCHSQTATFGGRNRAPAPPGGLV